MIHRKYKNFIVEQMTVDSDIFAILDIMKDLPTKEILEFRDSLGDLIVKNESLNEGIVGDWVIKMKDKFHRGVFNQIWKYIINKKKDFYMEVIEKLNWFDLESLDDVKELIPSFKLTGLYLAGGMDKAVDVGAGWRYVVENEFETYKRKESDLPEINMGEFGDANPCRVIEGEFLNMYLADHKKTEKLYPCRPVILNPVRKEVDRTKDPEFAAAAKGYKSFGQDTPSDEYEPTITNIRTTLSKTIEPDDEHLVRITDATFLGLNPAAASGTFGEAETLSYMNKPIFVWMTSPGWSFSDYSMWTIPHMMKLARNESEMKILVKTLIDYAEKK